MRPERGYYGVAAECKGEGKGHRPDVVQECVLHNGEEVGHSNGTTESFKTMAGMGIEIEVRQRKFVPPTRSIK